MSEKTLIKQLVAEISDARQRFKEGKGIPIEQFDWGFPTMVVREIGGEYRPSET